VKFARTTAKGPAASRVGRPKPFSRRLGKRRADTRIHGTPGNKRQVFQRPGTPNCAAAPSCFRVRGSAAPGASGRLHRVCSGVLLGAPEYCRSPVWRRGGSRLCAHLHQRGSHRRSCAAERESSPPIPTIAFPAALRHPTHSLIICWIARPADGAHTGRLGRGRWSNSAAPSAHGSCTACCAGPKTCRSKRWKARRQKSLHHGAWRLRTCDLVGTSRPEPNWPFWKPTH